MPNPGVKGGPVLKSKQQDVILCIGNDFVNLNLRCSLLKEHGWCVLSSGSGHEGVIRFGQERVDAVVLDLRGDGSESALIASELKRLRPKVPVIMLVANREALVPGATEQADAVLLKADESRVLPETLRSLLKIC
jgi:DNA-binding response OmpR family regulator